KALKKQMRIYTDFDLTQYNSYRIKARCKRVFFPENEKDVVDVYEKGLTPVLLGSGHNVILSRDHYNIDFLIFNGNFDNMSVDLQLGIIVAESGCTMLQLSELALNSGL